MVVGGGGVVGVVLPVSLSPHSLTHGCDSALVAGLRRSAAGLRAEPRPPRPAVGGESGSGAAGLAHRRAPPLSLPEEPGEVGHRGKNRISLVSKVLSQGGENVFSLSSGVPGPHLFSHLLGLRPPSPPRPSQIMLFFYTAATSVNTHGSDLKRPPLSADAKKNGSM